jgi:hypothetical protein
MAPVATPDDEKIYAKFGVKPELEGFELLLVVTRLSTEPPQKEAAGNVVLEA